MKSNQPMKYNEGTHCIPCELREKVWATLESRTTPEILPVPNLEDNRFCEEHEEEYYDVWVETEIPIWVYIASCATTCNY